MVVFGGQIDMERFGDLCRCLEYSSNDEVYSWWMQVNAVDHVNANGFLKLVALLASFAE